MKIDQLVSEFEACTLPDEAFKHEQHVAVGWSYLKQHDTATALKIYAENIRIFATHHGAPKLYHETITWFWVMLINERMNQNPELKTWDLFRAKNLDLVASDNQLIYDYYWPSTLKSALAKASFVLPDQVRN